LAQPLSQGKKLFFDLDNEPGLWPSTHIEVHPTSTTYAEMMDRSVRYATMIKRNLPGSLVFGSVAWGAPEYVNLQSAPDAPGSASYSTQGSTYRDALLKAFANAPQPSGGKGRLMDVLDLHYYYQGNNVLQSTREFWDPNYVDNSDWVTGLAGGRALQFLP
jgi:hypothetical protein